MGKIVYPNSLIYLVEELCTSSKTFQRNLIDDNSYQISLMVIGVIESRLFASFLKRIPIESGRYTNLHRSGN
ncbi:hypothetical protein BHE74_00025549 [Ensete ventricosum]|nr:hypothetical protein GW17_00026499 [Ensete ventricosum]RWW67031.1 hypothetical protein BHE74_00025549 [Ensete ventricosum]RZS03506.1 hypothetical protein BHM03_00033699 [Ensete ventricosum]